MVIGDRRQAAREPGVAQGGVLELQRAQQRLIDGANGDGCGQVALGRFGGPTAIGFLVLGFVMPQHLKAGQRPVAVVAVPSRSRPTLVSSLAQEISRIGRLPLLGSLELVDGGPTSHPGANSPFRVAGLWQRLCVGDTLRAELSRLTGPVLLVYDHCDSRWTLTMAARELRRAGADDVLALVLATA